MKRIFNEISKIDVVKEIILLFEPFHSDIAVLDQSARFRAFFCKNSNIDVFLCGEEFFFFSGFSILFEGRVSSVKGLILDSIDAFAPVFFLSPSIRSNEKIV